MPYEGSGESMRKGDVVHINPSYRGYGALIGVEGVIVRVARDETWADVQFYIGPGKLYPDIVYRTIRIPSFKLKLARKGDRNLHK